MRKICCSLLFVAAGCTSIGPDTISRDRFDYSAALGDSWKHQTLLNLVKLRYMDLPIFLDVGQIVSGYSLETGVSANGTLSSSGAVQGDFLALGGSARFTDRPTITYTPMTGDRFLRNMLEPFPPQTLFKMLQAGYAADALFELTVESFNGLRNRSSMPGGGAADPRFLRVLALMRKLQATGTIGTRVETAGEGGPTTVVFFRGGDGDPEIGAMVAELRGLLALDAPDGHYELIYAPVQERDGQLAVRTRSLLQVLMALASFVEVPTEDVSAGVATSAPPIPESQPTLLHVKSGTSAPADAFFAVPFRDHWFWIDDTDLASKRTFAFVMFLFTLADSGGSGGAPVLTIPAS